MIRIDVRGLDDVRRRLEQGGKQVRFAAAVALTRTAKLVEAGLQKEAGRVFDRPKPQTLKATYTKRADKNTLTAEVGFKQRGAGVPAAEYLAPNVTGGKRTYKRSEFMLLRAGILPSGMFTVPGAAAKLDAFGNMSRGQINQILSYFRTFGNSTLNTKRMNMTDRRRAALAKKKNDYLLIPVGNKQELPPGIWQRSDRGIRPILMFISAAQYKKIFNFHGVGLKLASGMYGREFDKAYAEAMATAR